jgi:hypothetical protein
MTFDDALVSEQNKYDNQNRKWILNCLYKGHT